MEQTESCARDRQGRYVAHMTRIGASRRAYVFEVRSGMATPRGKQDPNVASLVWDSGRFSDCKSGVPTEIVTKRAAALAARLNAGEDRRTVSAWQPERRYTVLVAKNTTGKNHMFRIVRVAEVDADVPIFRRINGFGVRRVVWGSGPLKDDGREDSPFRRAVAHAQAMADKLNGGGDRTLSIKQFDSRVNMI